MVDFETYFSVCLICLIFTVFIWRLSKLFHANSRLPPGPFALPILGHLHLLVVAPSPHRAFHKLYIRYGPVFRLYLGSTLCVVISSPEIAKEIFKTQDNVFLDKPHNSSVDRISYGANNGFIFAPYGSYWKFMKKIVMSELLNTRTLDVLLPVRNDEIIRLINCLSEKANDGKSVELGLELMKMTNNGISRMLMGKRCSEEEDEAVDIRKIISEISELIVKFNLSDHIWFCKNLDLQGFGKQSIDIHTRFDALIERVLREHQEARKQKDTGQMRDLLDILLDISEAENMEMKLTTDSIKAFILDIFAAGTDTSATSVEWTLAELINHPNIMNKALEEIDQVVGKNRLLQESDIPKLPYLQAIVKESLRLHPVVPLIQRLSTEDCTLGGYHIPENTTIFINAWEVGRDPTHWENPLEFMPERFENKQLDVRGQHFQLVPFGGGRRMCPGTSLALMVIHVTVGSMIQCFDWKAGKDGNLNSVDMEEGNGITLPRANPLVCVPVARLYPIPLSA